MTTTWSIPASVRAALQRRWERGEFLTRLADATPWEPVDIPIRTPTASDVAHQFLQVQQWATQWRAVDAQTMQQSVDSLDAADSRLEGARNDLGMALHARYMEFGRPADLEAAIDQLTDLAAAVQRSSTNRGAILCNLASALLSRYNLGGTSADLHWACELTERAVRQASIGKAERAEYYLSLCKATFALLVTGAAGSYESCLQLLNQAEQLSAERTYRERLRVLRANVHVEQYRITGQPECLARALTGLPEKWHLNGKSAEALPELLVMAAEVLSDLYELMGATAGDGVGPSAASAGSVPSPGGVATDVDRAGHNRVGIGPQVRT